MNNVCSQRVDTKGRRNSTITWSAEQQMYVTTDLGLDLDTVRGVVMMIVQLYILKRLI